MARRLGAWARLTALGGVWGVGMAWFYDAPLAKGAVVGFGMWGTSLFVALRGPYAPVLEPAD